MCSLIVKPSLFMNFDTYALLTLKCVLSIPVSEAKTQASCVTISHVTRRDRSCSSFMCATSSGRLQPAKSSEVSITCANKVALESALPHHLLKDSQLLPPRALGFRSMQNALAALLKAAVNEHRKFFFGSGQSRQ